MRVLFYAINKVGLGHAVRLSIFQKIIQRRRIADCFLFTDSEHVDDLFTCPAYSVKAPGGANDPQRFDRILRGFQRALDDVQPHVVVCDTYWPQHAITQLRNGGVRTILLLRLMNSRIMRDFVDRALEAFDTLLIPHHPAEVRWTYRKSPRLIRYLESQAIGFVGPIARRAATVPKRSEVIFTVGGGGEWPGASYANRIPTYLNVFYETAGMLIRRGYPRPGFVAGPLVDVDGRFSSRLRIIRTKNLFARFGPGTVVVSRGGYNTCWEAVGASSRLVLCGSHKLEEDVDARCRFLQHELLGRKTPLSARHLVDAIECPWTDREQGATSCWASQVNSGVPIVLDEIIGGTFLRARES